MPNYGDVALNLPPDWSRTRVGGDTAFTLLTVGHENGIADAFLTDDPDKAHQFRWCAPDDKNAMSTLRTRHYQLCTSKDWTKNPDLWEWDGDGYILHNGQRLLARDGIYYYQDIAEKERLDKQREGRRGVTQEEEQSMARVEAQGAIIEDERGRQLRPLSNKGQK